MEILKLSKKNSLDIAKQAAEQLQRGYAVIFPTDTFYALGVNALDEKSVERLFKLKKRPERKPVPIFVRDFEMAAEVAFIDKKQEAILRELWPGPFTFILPKKKIVSTQISAGTDKVGLRIPDYFFCRDFLNIFGAPITGSSANISGMEATTNVDEIVDQFKSHTLLPEMFVDVGNLVQTSPSTVIDLTGTKPKILRMNLATVEQMQDIFGKSLSL